MPLDETDIRTWFEELKRIWPTTSEIDRWLDMVFDPPWRQDIRREQDDNKQTIWFVSDYGRGRSRSLAVEREVLRDFDSQGIIRVLEGAGSLQRIAQEDLLVRRAKRGGLEVVGWEAPRFDKWFWSPDHGEWFVAFQSSTSGISSGGPPPPIQHFVAIHGKNYAAIGVDGVRDISSLQFDDISSRLPPHDRRDTPGQVGAD